MKEGKNVERLYFREFSFLIFFHEFFPVNFINRILSTFLFYKKPYFDITFFKLFSKKKIYNSNQRRNFPDKVFLKGKVESGACDKVKNISSLIYVWDNPREGNLEGFIKTEWEGHEEVIVSNHE